VLRSLSYSRLALKLRRWHIFSRLGAEKVTIRSHLPWPWRLLLACIIAVLAILFGGTVFDEIRRLTGFGGGAAPAEAERLRFRITQLEKDLHRTQELMTADNLVDRSATDELLSKINRLESENSRLKEEIAIFEQLGKGLSINTPVTITRFSVTSGTVPDRFHYEAFIAQRSENRHVEFKGNIQLLIHLKPKNNDTSANMILLPRPEDPNPSSYTVAFRAFEKVNGSFDLPDGAVPHSVEIRLLQGKSVRASKLAAF
jgi:hypothetical protein